MIKITKRTEKIPVYDIEVEDNHNFFANDVCVHNCEISQPAKSMDHYNNEIPEIGCCILGNMNFGYTAEKEIPKVADFLVRFLDNLIDVSDYTIPEVEYSAKKRRGLGIGVSNLFGYLAKSKQFYNLKSTREHIHDLMEIFYYNLIKSSVELAKEKGKCELFNDSIYSESKFIFERFNNNFEFKNKLDWESLRDELKQYGMRHSSLAAVPPAGNSSKLSGATPGVEPPRELVTIKTDKNMTIKQLVPFYKNSKNYYTTAWSDDFNNKDYFKLISTIQKFVDQSISLNQYTDVRKYKDNKINISEIIDELIFCFNNNIKSLYYQNFRSTENSDGVSEEDKTKCGSGGCEV